MKIIFDDVDELIAFLRTRCPGDVHPDKYIKVCDTGFYYDPVNCEKCFRKYVELEVSNND